MKLRVLFNKVLPPLREWEKEMLELIEIKLPPTLAKKYASQLSEINYVQRHCAGEEINFYRVHGAQVNATNAPRIDTPTAEYLLAKASVQSANTDMVLCSIWLVSGVLFSIEADKPTNSIKGAISIRVIEVNIP